MSKEHAYAYEAGYRDGSIHYELEHCPACKNVADLQEALAENAKLRELMHDFDKWLSKAEYVAYVQGHGTIYDYASLVSLRSRMRELGIEVD